MGLFLVFTLCGSPQYMVISDSSGFIENTPENIVEILSPTAVKQMFKSKNYEKRIVRLEDLTGVVCV